MKKLFEKTLARLTRQILKKYNPQIIGVTGSVGKTSTKEAIYTVLRTKYKDRVARSLKNYNNEIGLPLAVLQVESPGASMIKWLYVLGRAVSLLMTQHKDFPRILVLEMGADHVGDIAHLTDIAPCHVGVLTTIGPSHLEHFGSIENIAREKGLIVTRLPKEGLAVLNRDDKMAYAFKDKTRAGVMSFGFADDADIRASEVVISEISSADDVSERVERIKGISFKLEYQGSTVPFNIPGVLGVSHVYASLAAAAIGLHYGMNLIEISDAIKSYKPEPGRMALIVGIKKSLLIDDTYNASPASCGAALDVLSLIEMPETSLKWAVLGDMLELGSYSEQGHLEVGEKAAHSGINYLVTVGELSRDIARGAIAAGMPENYVFQFATVAEAENFIQNKMHVGDLLLVKGSQGSRMEKVVKGLMADPLKAPELLVRQYGAWLNS